MKTLKSIGILTLILLCTYACKTDQPTINDSPEVVEVDSSWTRSITGMLAQRGLVKNSENAFQSYILFNPSASTSTYLMDKKGNIVHEWKSDLNSMQAYLKPNGNIVKMERDPDFPTFAAGGQSGRIREYTWDGEMVWDFRYVNEKYLNHHDIALMPNGNILAISYDAKTQEECLAAGRDPEHVNSAGLWPDKIIEIRPSGPKSGEIVWEWRMWDHLIQDKFPDKSNYGNLAENPRKINFNVFEPHGGPPMTQEQVDGMIKQGMMTSNATVENQGSDITHCNGIYYNESLDQIAVSVPGYSEIFIIDHSTTIAEAASDKGGKYGHGGDLLFRWGNPQNYGMGSPEDRILYFQHDIRWISDGLNGAGNLMVFNNDIPGPKAKFPNAFAALMTLMQSDPNPDPQISVGDMSNYSAVLEFSPQTTAKGVYALDEGQPFKADIKWKYTAPNKYSFYSPFVSGAHRIPNGNTMILSGAQGRFFEVDPAGNIVWEYWQPYFDDYKLPDGTASQPTGPFIFGQFRIQSIPKDFTGLNGKELKPINPQPEPFKLPPPPPPTEM
jgi:hypothetical protein